MRRSKIQQQAEALHVLVDKIDIHRCQFCREQLHVHVETARNTDLEITVFCPSCQVSITASDVKECELASLIDHCCEAFSQISMTASKNNSILHMPSNKILQ